MLELFPCRISLPKGRAARLLLAVGSTLLVPLAVHASNGSAVESALPDGGGHPFFEAPPAVSPLDASPAEWTGGSLGGTPAFETPQGIHLLAGPPVEPCDDVDEDEVCDEDDNCVVVPNADQADVDDNGIGNVCECGDASGDGRVTTVDARLIQRCAVSDLTDPGICEGLCDVNGDGNCTTVDARLIQRLAVGQLQPSDLSCAARPAP